MSKQVTVETLAAALRRSGRIRNDDCERVAATLIELLPAAPDPLREALDDFAVWAVRYTLGRRTYAPHDVIGTLEWVGPLLRAETRDRIIADIDRAIAEANCGADFDCDAWRKARAALAASAAAGEGGEALTGGANNGPHWHNDNKDGWQP